MGIIEFLASLEPHRVSPDSLALNLPDDLDIGSLTDDDFITFITKALELQGAYNIENLDNQSRENLIKLAYAYYMV